MGLACCSQPKASDSHVSEEVFAKIRACMEECVLVPQSTDKVFKDECMFSFDTPYMPGGLFVNLKTWQGFSADYLELDRERCGTTRGALYMVRRCRYVAKSAESSAKPAKLAIGVEGGFQLDRFDTVEDTSLAFFGPGKAKPVHVPLPCQELPELVASACKAVALHQGAKTADEVDAWTANQEKKPSKYAEGLVQLPVTKKISPHPKDWRCEKSGDTQNLWLNLSDGFIGGGRRYFDGSGGSNGALDHYKEEKAKGNEYPLTVKLGTITPHGADVYSYAEDEDDLVVDPKLADHLAHWGIDAMKMEKTDKSIAEMEVDLNMNYDWSKICETGEQLAQVRGPGLVGLRNLGNSCYLNATIQLLWTLPEFGARYVDADCALRRSAPPAVAEDFIAQMAKLANGLLSDRYTLRAPEASEDDENDPALHLEPQMFRALVGRGHPEFSSSRQQDAAEFLQHLLEQLTRAERPALGSRLPLGRPLAGLLEFSLEERYACVSTGEVSYKRRPGHNLLALPVRLEDADNAAEVEAWRRTQSGDAQEEPKPIVPVKACLGRFAAREEGVSFRGRNCAKTVRLASMPQYLVVQIQRYYVDETWTPRKLDCLVPMPDSLDLEHLRGRGAQPGETEIPEAGANASGAAAAGAGAPAATTAGDDPGAPPDREQIEMLTAMGFTEPQVRAALRACENRADRAADWLFSHADDLDAAVASSTDGAGDDAAPEDGPGSYRLVGFVSHVGKNTCSGHYVCHVWKEAVDGWVIFNDEKVSKSETPPKDLGYLYLYRRV